MKPTRFKIIFDRVDDPDRKSGSGDAPLVSEELNQELDEIEVLRQIVLEIQNPEPPSYTTV